LLIKNLKAEELVMDDDDLFVQAWVSWIAVKTDDVNAVAEILELENVRAGGFAEWGYDSSPNTFLYVAQDQWVIVYHKWEYTGELEIGATNEEISHAVYKADVNLLNRLSNRFGESQSFGFDEEYTIGDTHWAASKNGQLTRYFKWGSEDKILNIGEITQAEDFIDWGSFNNSELVQEDSDHEFSGNYFGSVEILKIARQWSVDPLHDEHPHDKSGILGDGKISIV
jgi:hypothetical protein